MNFKTTSIFTIVIFFMAFQATPLLAQQAQEVSVTEKANQVRSQRHLDQLARTYELSPAQQKQYRKIHSAFLQKVKTTNGSTEAIKKYRQDRERAFKAILTPEQKVKMEERKTKREERKSLKGKRNRTDNN